MQNNNLRPLQSLLSFTKRANDDPALPSLRELAGAPESIQAAPIQLPTDPVDFFRVAYATEKQAAYMYEAAAINIRGNDRLDLVPEYKIHEDEEEDHAGMAAERLVQLGGVVPSSLDNFAEISPFKTPAIITVDIPAVNDIIEASEVDAITLYKHGVELFKELGDSTSRRICEKILEKEEEHLYDVKVDFKGGVI